MSKREKCLFIGNGLNRCLAGSVSWDRLLRDVANRLHVEYHPDIPLPMEYERMIHAYLKSLPDSERSDRIYKETKDQIADITTRNTHGLNDSIWPICISSDSGWQPKSPISGGC